MSQKKSSKSDRQLKLRMGRADIPVSRFRPFLMVFFLMAGTVFLWRPTQWLAGTFERLSLVGGDYTGLLAPEGEGFGEAFPSLPTGLLAQKSKGASAAPAKKDRSVVFRLLAPGARQVFLGGTFNNFDARQHALTKNDEGVWEISLDLSPGRYLYKFKVDGEWTLDPTNPDQTTGERVSSILSIQ